jgi:hypothetical protein
MARRRDYAREYARAVSRARDRGFGSVREMLQAPRLPRHPEHFGQIPPDARQSRAAAAAAIHLSRETGRPLELTAQGITVGTVRYWFPDAVGSTRRGLTRPTKADRHTRLRPLAVEGEVAFLPIHGSRQANRAFDIFGTQWRFIHGKANEAELEQFQGARIAGRTVETDPAVLERLASAGQFRIDELYRDLIG